MLIPSSKTPPSSPYGTFDGTLFQYHKNLVAFESSRPDSLEVPQKKCILIGGLSDGLIPTPYTSKLLSVCHENDWSLVQPLLSSSYLGFGNGSLERDSAEIECLLKYLSSHRNATQFAMVGHSTGCQNSVHLLKHCEDKNVMKMLKLVVLQAPVSDREGAMLEANYESNIQHARSLFDGGNGDEMMPRSSFWAPITATRFLSLQDKGGQDDFFSSDFTDEELEEKLSHIGRYQDQGLKLLAAFSGADEYVPVHVNKEILLKRMCKAMNAKCCDDKDPVAVPLMVTHGNHNLATDMDTFIDEIGCMMSLI